MATDLNPIPLTLRHVLGDSSLIEDLGDEICVQSSGSPRFCVFYSPANPPSEAEGDFILTVVAQQEFFVGRARQFLLQSPLLNGASLQAAQPQLLFRPAFEFDVHFQSVDAPSCPNGVIVSFQKEIPVAITPVGDGDAWWDEDSGTWVEG